MKNKTSHWAGCIDAICEAFKVDAALPEFIHQQHEIPHAASETIQLPDNQRISLFQRLKKLFQRWPVSHCPAHFFFENLFTSCAFERLPLKIRILVIC